MNSQDHQVAINNRQEMALTGVVSVESFDEVCILMETTCGSMVLEGEGLHITELDLGEGKVHITGKVVNLLYKPQGTRSGKGKNILDRLLK